MAGESEQVDVIRIRVGPTLIAEHDKDTLPEFWWGREFEVLVDWIAPADGLFLTMSDFRVVSAETNPDPDAESIWTLDRDLELHLYDEQGTEIREVSFAFSEAKDTGETAADGSPVYRSKRTLKLVKDPTERDEAARRHLLVMFKQTLSKVIFEIDPPWVGKPPVG